VALPQFVDGGDSFQICRIVVNILNKVVDSQQGMVLQLGDKARDLKLLAIKNKFVTKCY
jgi:hypothetical protein